MVPDGKWLPEKGLKNIWKAEPGDNAETLAKDAGISLEEVKKIISNHPYITGGTYVATGPIGMETDNNTTGLDVSNTIANAVEGLEKDMERTEGTVRVTDGACNGNKFSPKYYKSGWSGGNKARIKTYIMKVVLVWRCWHNSGGYYWLGYWRSHRRIYRREKCTNDSTI
jgi:hypothetical protein